MTVKILDIVKDYPGRLFVEIPMDLREKAKLTSGDVIQGTMDKILDLGGKARKINEKIAWEVGEFTNMLIVPRDVVEHLHITPGGLYEAGDRIQLTLRKVRKKDGTTLAV